MMSSGRMMTQSTHGIREGSKAEGPDEANVKAREKEKDKAEEEEDISDQEEEKAEEIEEGKAALIWRVKKVLKNNGMKMMKGIRH